MVGGVGMLMFNKNQTRYDFARSVIKLSKGNYMVSIGRVYVYFKVK